MIGWRVKDKLKKHNGSGVFGTDYDPQMVVGNEFCIHYLSGDQTHRFKIILREGDWVYCQSPGVSSSEQFLVHLCSKKETSWCWMHGVGHKLDGLICLMEVHGEQKIPPVMLRFIQWYEKWAGSY